MYVLLTEAACLETAVENQLKPLVSAATGSDWKSGSLLEGGGAEPKPVYLPPWLGATSSGRVALAEPILAKYASFWAFWEGEMPRWGGDATRSRGVFRPDPPDIDDGAATAGCFLGAGLYEPGTNSLSSTLHDSLSFHSSPASLSYRSEMVQLSKSRPLRVLLSWLLKKSFQGLLPPSSIRFTSLVLRASMVADRTNEMWTPRDR